MPRVVTERQDIIPTLGEIFRERGFSGTSLSEITQRTGLGKGSLYHFFPKGKGEMAEAVLDDISNWFEKNVFSQLRENSNPKLGIKKMFEAVNEYFYSGERICLIGAFALDNTRDQFAEKVNAYFNAWNNALAIALKRNGYSSRKAKDISEEIVLSIQGALVLARSQDDSKIFKRTIKRLQQRITANYFCE